MCSAAIPTNMYFAALVVEGGSRKTVQIGPLSVFFFNVLLLFLLTRWQRFPFVVGQLEFRPRIIADHVCQMKEALYREKLRNDPHYSHVYRASCSTGEQRFLKISKLNIKNTYFVPRC